MRIWDKYLKCKEYAEKKQITQRTNEQWNFYNDKQWEGLESGGEILPFFNFIKPICRYKLLCDGGFRETAFQGLQRN